MSTSIHSLFDLTGRVALVTGGCGHLGTALAEALAEAGATVIVSSRDPQRGQATAQSLPSPHGAQHASVCLDHKDADSCRAGFHAAVDVAGGVDILVNNGQGGPSDDWRTVDQKGFQDQLSNASGYFELARHLHRHAVEESKAANVIMLGSMYGIVGSYPDAYADVCPASSVSYHALKGGIIHMTRHLAVYWAADDVRVNCLSPGPFPAATAPAEMVERLKTKSPLGRMGQPTELKGAVVFLASDASSYVTGHNLVVDGGWTAW